MAKKIAEQLIDTLAESGVERIYAVTGDSLNEVNEAVRKNNKIKWIHVRHEETGAYAAAAEAQLTGRPGCCAGSSGPGHVHLINGLYDAQRSGAPEGVKFALEHLRSTPKETLYIGDSIVDAETARNARVDFAGVLNGMTTADELRAYPHRIIVKNLSDLL